MIPDRPPTPQMSQKVSHAASFGNAGISRRRQHRGTGKMREVIQTDMVLNRHSSSTAAKISSWFIPCGSRMDSALSRTMRISVEERKGRSGSISSGFWIPAPIALERWARK